MRAVGLCGWGSTSHAEYETGDHANHAQEERRDLKLTASSMGSQVHQHHAGRVGFVSLSLTVLPWR